MRVLIACEESQTVCKAFRAKGHEAFSCDIQPCSGFYPEWHFHQDIFTISPYGWDLIIAHPPCTFLCNSGALRLYKNGKKENGIDEQRWKNMEEGADFFKKMLGFDCDKICVENPIMHGHAKKIIGVNWSQIIQPYEYGHPESKATCLWLKGLPLLIPTKVLDTPESGYWENQTASGQNKLGSGKGKERSKTYRGIAEAMAEQWG